MQVLETTQLGTALEAPLVVTIGNFDGVHLGHRALLEAVVAAAKRLEALPACITFAPHPLKVLLHNPDIKLLTTSSDKVRLIEDSGIKLLFRLRFDEALARTSAREFVVSHLHKNLQVAALVVGHDYALGYRKQGDFSFLQDLGNELGFQVIEVLPVTVDGMTVSSTKIRECLVNGHIQMANRLLGRAYTITGTVGRFAGRGHSLGLPTANLVGFESLLPQNGVYITEALFEGQALPSVVNVGHHPTFYSETTSVEAHIIDERLDLYGKQITIAFLQRIRAERRFASRTELIRQICSDIDKAREFFQLGQQRDGQDEPVVRSANVLKGEKLKGQQDHGRKSR